MTGERGENSPDDWRKAVNFGVRAHQMLGERLGREFYSVPAFDMLLDLYLLKNRKPRSLTNLCGAAHAPVRTALRTINRMVDRGLLARELDPRDGRRVNVMLTPHAIALLDGYFATILGELLPRFMS